MQGKRQTARQELTETFLFRATAALRSGGWWTVGGGRRQRDAELIREQIQSQAWIGLTNEPQGPCSGFQT